ncbi:hypothetical protein HOP50_03g21090 [Chloropicon primus]|uniref:CGL160/ATPI domain-containing protein n=2 Tax=Chloropicon primus TaxID=1764295 RepID=A0A5B8MH36_9CHLO|nr:hypothetical protein A3770_03p21090 [Chloropicon primus]UPQ98803.1 hypothetical protein HOP50_03g21090 [Chloropicon primus]|eukprot:QDZ19591.1 hypothetical protein A3770_03p21090 [Chloropicon primus]
MVVTGRFGRAGLREGVVAQARNDRSVGDVRNRLAKLRPENAPKRDKRKDQGYLRVDDDLLKDDNTLDKVEEGRKRPAEGRRFRDKLARESSEFIWNSDWRKDLENWEKSSTSTAGPGSPSSSSSAPASVQPEGGISFSRISELNDLSVDLSEQLRPRARSEDDGGGAEAGSARGGRKDFLNFPGRASGAGSSSSSGGKYAGEAYSQNIMPADPEVTARANEKYAETKGELFVYTLLTGLVVGGLCNNLYGQDVAVSYGAGCAASLFYLRLLSRTVDAVASEDATAQVGGAGGQARLLVPAVLVLFYSKQNQWVLDNYGVKLNIIAILAGFFTYKAGTFGQVLKSTVALMAEDRRRS